MPSGLFDRLDITEERISELEGMTIETLKLKSEKKKKASRISKDYGTTTKYMCIMRIPEGKERKKQSNI